MINQNALKLLEPYLMIFAGKSLTAVFTIPIPTWIWLKSTALLHIKTLLYM
jgi:hypothetical protein